MNKITLTDDQQNALKVFGDFLLDNDQKYLIVQGAAGSGKSTLITYMAKLLEAQFKMYSLLLQKNKNKNNFEMVLTATTNKAAAVLQELTNRDASTIHSLLNLTVQPDFSTGEVKLKKKKDYCLIYNNLIIIDEASMVNDRLFNIIDETTIDCKIVLIGDQYQLAPVKQKVSIMETLDCTKVTMNKIMRNSGIIKKTGAQFRDTVETGIFKNIPQHSQLDRVDGPTFKKLVNDYFTASDYTVNSAKVLAWTNKRVLEYNQHIRSIKGYPELYTEGEIVYTNNPIMHGRKMWPTDSAIEITNIGSPLQVYDVEGCSIELDNVSSGFFPFSPLEVKALLKHLAKEKNWRMFYQIKEQWLDLRPAYASTVHKAQGATYDTVFMDLSDIGRCNIASDVARMLYVSISRASNQVYLYGDLPNKYKE